MHLAQVQHLVLDDVADAGEDILVEQGVADEFFGHGAEFPAYEFLVPLIRHDVDAPVVAVRRVAFQQFYRAVVEMDLAVPKSETEPWRDVLAFVDQVTAEHQQMHAHVDAVEHDQRLLAEAAPIDNALAFDTPHVDLGVAFGARHPLADEDRRFVAEDRNGRTFGHKSSNSASSKSSCRLG